MYTWTGDLSSVYLNASRFFHQVAVDVAKNSLYIGSQNLWSEAAGGKEALLALHLEETHFEQNSWHYYRASFTVRSLDFIIFFVTTSPPSPPKMQPLPLHFLGPFFSSILHCVRYQCKSSFVSV
ncbi:hypothetical protein VNO78_27174 [Psophocarpus tetragonolobus]|uniref:Uncharacterized protein n=1 Tax=Psophocarpus tetragonolobus TaxID=3891 RepID=A0AAN9XAX5_PSOTE